MWKKILLFKHICWGQSVVSGCVPSCKWPGGTSRFVKHLQKKKEKKRFPYRFPSNGHVKVLSQNPILCPVNKTGAAVSSHRRVPQACSIARPECTEWMERRVAKGRIHASSHAKSHAPTWTLIKPFIFLAVPDQRCGFHVRRPSNTEAQGATVSTRPRCKQLQPPLLSPAHGITLAGSLRLPGIMLAVAANRRL